MDHDHPRTLGPGGACAPAAQGFPGGYCVYACAATAQAGTACTSAGVCSGPGDQNLCFRRCSPGASGGCRQGYVCLDITGGGTVGVCYPNCTSNPGLLCGAYRCNATTGACGGGRCTDSARCSPGSYCGVLSARCECTAATSCGPNHRCYVFVTGSRCGCANDAGCGPGRTCNTNNGTCQ